MKRKKSQRHNNIFLKLYSRSIILGSGRHKNALIAAKTTIEISVPTNNNAISHPEKKGIRREEKRREEKRREEKRRERNLSR